MIINQMGGVPAVNQATPSISVSASGLITATTTQAAGKVKAGTKSATQQLTTQAATTVTPGTSDQTVVASGTYTTGDVTVAGDADLISANILSGVNIFGVAGSAPKVISSTIEVQEGSASSYPEGTLYVVYEEG